MADDSDLIKIPIIRVTNNTKSIDIISYNNTNSNKNSIEDVDGKFILINYANRQLNWTKEKNNIAKIILPEQSAVFQPLFYEVDRNSLFVNQLQPGLERTIYILYSTGYDDFSRYYYDGLFASFGYRVFTDEKDKLALTNSGVLYKWNNESENKTEHSIDDLSTQLSKFISGDYNDKTLLVAYDLWQQVCKYLDYNEDREYVPQPNRWFSESYHAYSVGPQNLRNALNDLVKTEVRVLPNIDFMHDVGTKVYARHMKHFMLPNTYIYPDDNDQFSELKDDKTYIVKAGTTSSSRGILYITGSSMKKKFRRSNIKLDKAIDELSGTTDCQDRIYIIQPYNEIYEYCHEFRFMVLRDKIIGLADPREYRYNNELKITRDNVLNKHIYEFLQKVIFHVSDKYTDYLYMRIDVIIECGSRGVKHDEYGQDLPSKPNDIDIIFTTDSLAGKIWLNEIEPLGSGHKSRNPILFYDTGKEALIKEVNGSENDIFSSICYQTNRLISGLDNKDITICLLNLDWFEGKYKGNIRHVNLDCEGTWNWEFVEQLMKQQLDKKEFPNIGNVEFFVGPGWDKIDKSKTIISTLYPKTKELKMYGFRLK